MSLSRHSFMTILWSLVLVVLAANGEESTASIEQQSLSEWNEFKSSLENATGASISEDDHLRYINLLNNPRHRAIYIFTKPDHPAYPAVIFRTAPDGSTIWLRYGRFVGDREEFMEWWRQFDAFDAASAEDASKGPLGSGKRAAADAVTEREQIQREVDATLTAIADLLDRLCDWCTRETDDIRNLGANLMANQTAWQTWARAECELLYNLEGPGWNQWATARFAECEMQQSQTRLARLEMVKACLESPDVMGKSGESVSCLRNLTPHLSTP